jgi:TRAP-type C4-dicarboxylate transport system permease small subunit
MRKWKHVLETIPAILLLFMVLLTSASVGARYLVNAPIPDEYEISRMLLAVVICWGVAAAFYYNDHIYLDVMWGRISARAKMVLTRIGTLLSLLIVGSYSVALWFKVMDTMRTGLLTIDLGISVWGFQLAAWLGTLASVIILLSQTIWPSKKIFEEHHLEQGF